MADDQNTKKDKPENGFTVKLAKEKARLAELTGNKIKLNVNENDGNLVIPEEYESINATRLSGTSGYLGTASGLTGYSGEIQFTGSPRVTVSPGIEGHLVIPGGSGIFFGSGRDKETSKKIRELEETITSLRTEAKALAKDAQKAKADSAERADAINKYEEKIEQISKKERVNFLLNGVHEKAQRFILESEEFQKKFLDASCNAFIMSIDIRRSTELMSKARTPQQFANFMTNLCKKLEIAIKNSYGVFDKFTGDGVLAFFPDFYSGDDAGYYVISVADQCHKIFAEQYRESRGSFISVLSDVGLGIGIDYGTSYLVQMAGGLTVVGAPVVYACRMSGAPASTTLLNQPGYEKIREKFGSSCFFEETEIEIKNEGKTLAYKVRLNGRDYTPLLPTWLMAESAVNLDGK
jgi:class 3 adenylate cyclase/outer membrane murein-binding lipoprotein Lpp